MSRPHERLRAQALFLAGVDEGVACAGTALEKRTLRVGKKSFLFLRPVDAMFKLDASLGEARELAARAPAACKVGASGWVTITFAAAGAPAPATLSSWVAESHALLGGDAHEKPAPRRGRASTKAPKAKSPERMASKPKPAAAPRAAARSERGRGSPRGPRTG